MLTRVPVANTATRTATSAQFFPLLELEILQLIVFFLIGIVAC
jgi:hypothetical protein